MAECVVCDVAGRLLGYLGQWQAEDIGPYIGGKRKLKEVENDLRMIQGGLVDAEIRVNDEGGVVIKTWLIKLKCLLYQMEELLEEVAIAQQEKNRFPGGGKLTKPLSILVSKPSLFTVNRKRAQQIQALIGKLAGMISDMRDYKFGEQTDELPTTFSSLTLIENHVQDFNLEYYHQLTQHLKQCFAYCSIFPRDYEFNKTDLIYLWEAQGFLQEAPLNGNQPEAVGHEYWIDLLRRGFFRDSIRNEEGQVVGCKMHKQAHDLARSVSGDACASVDEPTSHSQRINPDSIFHVSFIVHSSWEAPEWLRNAKRLRSLLLFPKESNSSFTIRNIDELFSYLQCLRVLDLGKANCNDLPKSIGKLKHLRYLKLGGLLESLPECITKLQYLRTLDIKACHRLNKIPRGSDHFATVRLLCNAEHHQFTVDESNSLDTLANLDRAIGKLEIYFRRYRQRARSEAETANLRRMRVNELMLEWSTSYGEVGAHVVDNHEEESIMKMLQPPRSLKNLAIRYWKGTSFPSWRMDSLVSIEIEGCNKCQYLPSMSRLPLLRYLQLSNLKALEYIEKIDDEANYAAYFPNLNNLKLEELPELKAWLRNIDQQNQQGSHQYQPQQLAFPQLLKLVISHCPRLISMPQAPRLESLLVEEIPEDLLTHLQVTQESPASSSALSSLRELQITAIHQLISLSITLPSLESLRIKRCEALIKLIAESPTTLQRLEVYNCGSLRDVSGALQDLKDLKFWGCEELKLLDMVKGDGSINVKSTAWQGLLGLHSLTLGSITRLESLPRGLVFLKGLQELCVFQVRNLKALPEWIGELCQLKRLEIVECSRMRTLLGAPVRERECFRINLPSLTLRIERCQQLIDLFGGTPVSFPRLEINRCGSIKHISGQELTVEEVVVENFDELHIWPDDDKGQSSGRNVIKNVNSLTLLNIRKLESLPRSFLTCLSTLKQLKLYQLHSVTLQLWIEHLTELDLLKIVDCAKLKTISIHAAHGGLEGVLVPRFQLTLLKVEQCQELITMNVESSLNFKSLEIRQCGNVREILGEELTIKKLLLEHSDDAIHLWEDEKMGKSHRISIKSLQSLTLQNLSKLEAMPRGFACLTMLRELKMFHLPDLKAIPEWIVHLNQLDELEIVDCPELRTMFLPAHCKAKLRIKECVRLIDIVADFQTNLKEVDIAQCDNIKDISGEELTIGCLMIRDCDELHLWEDKDSPKIPIKSLETLALTNILKLESLPRSLACLTTLQGLVLENLPNLSALPDWIGQLSLLEFLGIRRCPKVTALPDSFQNLTSLQELYTEECNGELQSRFQNITGEDWPKIQHIHDVKIVEATAIASMFKRYIRRKQWLES